VPEPTSLTVLAAGAAIGRMGRAAESQRSQA